MDDNYQYPVFFEFPGLQQRQIKNIERYFCVRRRSGGGECGPLRRVDDEIYSVAFKNQTEQQVVLQRQEHVVDGVRFSVRDSLDRPFSSPVTTSSASQDFTAPLQASNSAQETIQPGIFTNDTQQPNPVTPERIVLLGKTGSGKSHLANTIFGEDFFTVNHSPSSETSEGQSKTKSVNGRMITLIDTPGFFGTDRSEEKLKRDIVRCITKCSPGPHAFLIVLKVEKFTKDEQKVITEILQCFSEEALKYAVIVFTHGDQLQEGVRIEEFVRENKNLSDLVQKCAGRCHVVDNKYWHNQVESDYRSNQVQVKNLLNTVDKMVRENNGAYYDNEMLQAVDKEIQMEVAEIRQSSSGDIPAEEIRKQAETRVSDRLLVRLAGTATGVVLGALFGLEMMVRLVLKTLKLIIKESENRDILANVAQTAGSAATARGSAATAGGFAAKAIGAAAVGCTVAGGVTGGIIGYDAVNGAETGLEAIYMASSAVFDERKALLKQFDLNV